MPRNIDDLIHRHPGAVIGVFVPLSEEEAGNLDSDDEEGDDDGDEEEADDD